MVCRRAGCGQGLAEAASTGACEASVYSSVQTATPAEPISETIGTPLGARDTAPAGAAVAACAAAAAAAAAGLFHAVSIACAAVLTSLLRCSEHCLRTATTRAAAAFRLGSSARTGGAPGTLAWGGGMRVRRRSRLSSRCSALVPESTRSCRAGSGHAGHARSHTRAHHRHHLDFDRSCALLLNRRKCTAAACTRHGR